MSSDETISKIAEKIIKRNPEYFEALVEFEKTGKLPKFTFKKRIDITIDKDILNKFKEFCRKKGYKISNRIEKLIIKDLHSKYLMQTIEKQKRKQKELLIEGYKEMAKDSKRINK